MARTDQPAYQADEDAVLAGQAPPSTQPSASEDNAGRRAEAVSGAAQGSGAGAGGGGNPEDPDSDSAGGGGREETQPARSKPSAGADAPHHGSS